MIITFKNAKNNSTLRGEEFFNGNDYQFKRLDLTIAAINGEKAVEDYLKGCEDFNGKVIEVLKDTLNNKIFVKFTMERTTTKPKFSEETGEFLEEVEVKEDYNYLMIINLID